jgi:hypothetical protein
LRLRAFARDFFVSRKAAKDPEVVIFLNSHYSGNELATETRNELPFSPWLNSKWDITQMGKKPAKKNISSFRNLHRPKTTLLAPCELPASRPGAPRLQQRATIQQAVSKRSPRDLPASCLQVAGRSGKNGNKRKNRQ